MKVLEVAPQVYASGQLYEHDIRLAAKQGVRSIMNNRPDGETIGQPATADLEALAAELGITYTYLPINLPAVTRELVEEFAKTSESLERPLLIFCASGARSVRMWELAESL